MHIGFYSPELPDSGASSGIVTYTRIMRDALRALGHSVVVVTLEFMEDSKGRIVRIPKRNRFTVRAREILEATQRNDGSRPSLRVRMLDAFAAAKAAGVQVFEMEESFGWASRLTGQGVAIVQRLHGPHLFVRDRVETAEQRRIGNLRQAAEQASFTKVQAITAPSQSLLLALERHGLDRSISRAIPNPMPVDRLHPKWSLDTVRADQILFVGRFDRCKGADIAIRAFAEAVARRPSLKLVMVGPDSGLAESEGRKVLFDEFISRELSTTVGDRILFLGQKSPEEIAKLRCESSLALITSRFETWSYALTEAMAIGMPCLASSCFGPAEIIQNGVNGRLVPVGDVSATAAAILEMMANQSLLVTLGNSAQARVKQFLSPDRIARQAVEVYEEAVARL